MPNQTDEPGRFEKEYWPWSDTQTTLQNWAQKSASYLKRANLERDVPYGTSAAERLDLLKPSAANAPVLIFIHGGYWQWLDKDDYAFALEPLVTAGALVATINYPLCPEVSLDALVETVRNACAWMWRHARDHGGDPARLHVAGHSAGGHLAAMMAVTDWSRFQKDLPRDMIKSIIPISGMFDLEPLRSTSLNEGLRLELETVKRNSPMFMMPTSILEVSLVVGGDETNEFHRQSQELARAWLGKVGGLEYTESLGHDHFTLIESMVEPGNLLTATILRHLN